MEDSNGRIIFLVIAIILSVSLVGCDTKKKVDYNDTTAGQVTEEQVAVEDIQIPDHWDLTIDGAMSRTFVNADIILPDGYNNCSVVEYTDDDFQDEDIKVICDKVFDEDSYFLYMPYSEESRELLRDKLISLRDAAIEDSERRAIETTLENFEIMENYQCDYDTFEELKFYHIYDVAWNREIYKCDIIGTIDGVNFLLSFNKDKTNCYMKLNRFKHTANFQMMDVGSESSDVKVEGNVCTYSKEQAEEMAKEYVSMLGYDSMDVMWTNNVRCEYWDDDWWESDSTLLERRVDGYNFYFGRYYENYSMVYSTDNCNNSFDYWLSTDQNNDPIFGEGNEYIRIYVDSDGISEVEVFNPMKFERVISDNVVTLPYSTIENILVENFHNHADGNGSYELKVYEIRLGYEVEIDGDKKALVPTWFVFTDDNSNDSQYFKSVYMRVNALDGTVLGYKFQYY